MLFVMIASLGVSGKLLFPPRISFVPIQYNKFNCAIKKKPFFYPVLVYDNAFK